MGAITLTGNIVQRLLQGVDVSKVGTVSTFTVPARLFVLAILVQDTASIVVSAGITNGGVEYEDNVVVIANQVHTINIQKAYNTEAQIFVTGLTPNARLTLIGINI